MFEKITKLNFFFNYHSLQKMLKMFAMILNTNMNTSDKLFDTFRNIVGFIDEISSL